MITIECSKCGKEIEIINVRFLGNDPVIEVEQCDCECNSCELVSDLKEDIEELENKLDKLQDEYDSINDALNEELENK